MAGFDFPLPKVLTYPSSTAPELITQGAEGRLYKTTYLLPSIPCALKHRPSKPYRHPVLDARLTRQRILAEARILARCRREGVAVPAVFAVDEASGWLMMEWIAGGPVRASINEWLRGRTEADVRSDAEDKGAGSELVDLMRRMGAAVGKLHRTGIVHGDLTTSNMMLRPWSRDVANGHRDTESILAGEIVIIDFGLATTSTSDEDRAVDLYVLERAFGSTHPRGESQFPVLLQGYKEAFKQATPVLKKLEDVRMRGRKRSMLG
ncbi:putative bud32 protein kinase protein [Phaeoacremonium minimum UCRPA7]|uniref:EKC/KEOPS complex subunit BUD32 n=1 Tax=Phaeoacremonium minimum (strain UCR-PA7) TaxID=1286976 RepID=R8BTL9_PHAM7|nr:putative bud32 protein kinase protein [Phaeoacremonium minimum UCRPA7]EOO02706.1 putative bud32 protein kinase protein [Phaeoacremonium minimum UCRPA7]